MKEHIFDYMDWPRIEGLLYGEEKAPKDLLGPRVTRDGVLIQCFLPGAEAVSVRVKQKTWEMERQEKAGYFAALLPGKKIPDYSFLIKEAGKVSERRDPYAYPNQLTEKEERAFLGGVFYHAYERMGAHETEVRGAKGTLFAVWAPNARSVSLVGDFNDWNEMAHPMQHLPMSGIYELFVPDLGAGEKYKYAVRRKDGTVCLKADPYAQAAEKAPADASVVPASDVYEWEDDAWMQERWRFTPRNQPLSIYETDLMDWTSAQELASYLKTNGFTHVEFHPVMEYLDEETKGYCTSSYFSVTSRFGTAKELKAWIDLLHQEGVGVFLDWAPAQFPRYEGGLSRFDGTPLYEREEERMAVHPLWNTLLYNYGSPMVADFLISNACYWAEGFHADGLRLDDVDAMLYLDYGRAPSQYTPNIYGGNENLQAVEFLKHLTSILHKRYKGFLVLAQEDGLWPDLTGSVENDHLGFDYKWSGGWTKDLLTYLSMNVHDRRYVHDQLTASMLYAYCEHYILTLGTRDVGDLTAFRSRIWGEEENDREAQLRAAYAYLYLHPGCKMIAPDVSLKPEMSSFLKDLNALYREHPALWACDDSSEGFEWIQQLKAEENILVFLRKCEEETLLVIANFGPSKRERYEVGVPFSGAYKEIFSTDALSYGGSGDMNPRARVSRKAICDEREDALRVTVPAYGVIVFQGTPKKEKPKAAPKKTAVKVQRKVKK